MNRSPQRHNFRTRTVVSPREGTSAADSKSADYLLLTGASGLVGRYLTRDLLASGRRLAVLARSNRRMSAHDRIEFLLQRWETKLEREFPRPIVLEGDVTHPNLGLSQADRDWVRQHCHGLIHNAAIVKFEPAEHDQEPWQTNLYGTRHALEFARWARLTELHYVSTAYVCGNRGGAIFETELDCGQSFRNSYEESKFLAEKTVVECDGFERKTIYRPSIIAGDSTTGFTSSYHGLMWYLRLLSMLVPMQPRDEQGRLHTEIELPLNGDEPHNVITVDWVSKAICRILSNPESHGQTYHLVSHWPTTFRNVINWCCEYFNSTGVKYVGPDHERKATSKFAEMFFDSSRPYKDYDAGSATFDNRNFVAAAPDFDCPPICREQVIRYLEFGKQDCWGKRREPKLEKSHNARDVAQKIANAIGRNLEDAILHLKRPFVIGLNLVGPSGGQWNFTLAGPRRLPQDWEVHSGLIADSDHDFTLSTALALDSMDHCEMGLNGSEQSLRDWLQRELHLHQNGEGKWLFNGSARRSNEPNHPTADRDDIPALQPISSRLGIESSAN